MTFVINRDTSSAEIIERMSSGESLHCPACSAVLTTVPENWQIGTPLHGIECSRNQKHFLIHCDDASIMKEMRARMQSRMKRDP